MSAAQQIGDWSPEVDPWAQALRLRPPPTFAALSDPEDPFPTYRASTYPMHEEHQDAPHGAPTDPAEPPFAERETLPPEPDEGEKAAAVMSSMAPPPDSPLDRLAKSVAEFAIEARSGRGEILTEIRSVGAEVATLRHEAKRFQQRLSVLERESGDTKFEVAQLKRVLRRALRRITKLEAELDHTRKVTSVPPKPD